MTLPKPIERYYTAELFRLIQAELKAKDIIIDNIEQLQGMMIGMIYMVQIGSITTMFLKEEKLCTYTDCERVEKEVFFQFNGIYHFLHIPIVLIRLWGLLVAWDKLKVWCRDLWFDLKYKLVR